jgi:hypothetical protein
VWVTRQALALAIKAHYPKLDIDVDQQLAYYKKVKEGPSPCRHHCHHHCY